MTPCRGCGQSIIFIPKPDGGWMPCEPEPIDWAELEENEMAVHQSGKVYRVSPERNDPENGGSYYLAHWPNCSQAASFRKEK